MSPYDQLSVEEVLRSVAREEPGAIQAARERLDTAVVLPSAEALHPVWNRLLRDLVLREKPHLNRRQFDMLELMGKLGPVPEDLIAVNAQRLARDLSGVDARGLTTLEVFRSLGITLPKEDMGPAMDRLLMLVVRDNDNRARLTYERAAQLGLTPTAAGQARVWNIAVTSLHREEPGASRQMRDIQAFGVAADPESSAAQLAMRRTLAELRRGNMQAETTLTQLKTLGVPMDPESAQQTIDVVVRELGRQVDTQTLSQAAQALFDAGAVPSAEAVGQAMRRLVEDGLGGDIKADSVLSVIVSLGVRPDPASSTRIMDDIRRSLRDQPGLDGPAHRLISIVSGFDGKPATERNPVVAGASLTALSARPRASENRPARRAGL